MIGSSPTPPELHHAPRPAPEKAHPALQPGAQRQGARDPQLLHRHENHDHDLAAVLTALSAAAFRARIGWN